MVGCGNRLSEVTVVAQGEDGCRRCGHRLASCGIESMRPVEPLIGETPVETVEVVHDISAAQDQHSPAAQRHQLGGEAEVVLEGFPGIDGQLHDGDVGIRRSVDEHGP